MIGFHWLSLFSKFPFIASKLTLGLDNYELFFCYTKVFIKGNNFFSSVYLNVQKPASIFFCLVQIINENSLC